MSQILVLCLEVPYPSTWAALQRSTSFHGIRVIRGKYDNVDSWFILDGGLIQVSTGDWLIFTFNGCEGIWNTYGHAGL